MIDTLYQNSISILHLNFIDDSTLEQSKTKPLWWISEFFLLNFYSLAFVKVRTSHIFHYIWTVLNLISRLINQPFPERGTLKNPADSLNFTQNQFHKRCNTSEQIYASIKFIIILSYIESKMNITKDPTSLIFLCFTDCTRYMHYRTCSSMYTLFTRKLWLPYKKHQIAYIKWKIFFYIIIILYLLNTDNVVCLCLIFASCILNQ